MAKLKIHPLPMAKGKLPRQAVTYMVLVSEMLDHYIYCWYIEGASKRILVDTGMSGEAFAQRGHAGEESILSPFDALKKVGTSPEEIDIVIPTHLHADHIGYAHLYKNAKFIVQKAELEWAYNPHPIFKRTFRGRDKLLKGVNFQIVEGDTQIVEGVRVLHTPGHTPGGQSVMVDTEKGKAIICGMCTIRENFEPPEEFRQYAPVIAPGIHIDLRDAFASLIRIKEEADIVISLHDAEFAEVDTIG